MFPITSKPLVAVFDFHNNHYHFRFSDEDIEYLRTILPKQSDEGFYQWLKTLDCSCVKIYAMQEGSVVFPREPLIRVEGPIALTQLLETTLLNLVNFPSLIATNAARMRLAAGPHKRLIEFGLRRAQGPDGGISASKYAYLGGFEATSNVLAGQLFGIQVSGTHAHSFVMSYSSLDEIADSDFKRSVLAAREQLDFTGSNDGELAAFIGYAQSFPDGFVALIDTYDMLDSGVKNFIVVAWALHLIVKKAIGVRIDSGDLAYFSKAIREEFRRVDKVLNTDIFHSMVIVASNDINEDVLLAINREGHEIDVFGIGTHLVTCQKQPALGCVYKLVSINGEPRIKVSEDPEKMVIPGCKEAYRLYGGEKYPLVDLMQLSTEAPPDPSNLPAKGIMVRHPFTESKRALVKPTKVVKLLSLVFDGRIVDVEGGSASASSVTAHDKLLEARQRCQQQLSELRSDHTRELNPAPYKVSLSSELYDHLKRVWAEQMPVSELK
ncbi:MAG: nicotinate phosphoribosyltransferase [Cyanobacteria bacterium]|nr:nicotinate phosphoribosyltransferase [Cyanobacteriota bacterium]